MKIVDAIEAVRIRDKSLEYQVLTEAIDTLIEWAEERVGVDVG